MLEPPRDFAAWRALVATARAATGDWDESIQHIIQADADVLRVEGVSFWSMSEETSSIHCDAGYVSSGQFAERGATLMTTDLSAYFAAVGSVHVLQIEDVGVDTRMSGWREYYAARNITSILHVPIRVDRRLAGILSHEHVGPKRRFRTEEEEFARDIGQFVASALGERARTRAEERARNDAFLDNLSRVVFRAMDMREVACRAVDLAVPRLADGAFLFVLNRDGVLDCLAGTHVDPARRPLMEEMLDAMSEVPAQVRVPWVVIQQNKAMLMPEFSDAVAERYRIVRFHALRQQAGIHTGMAVPLAIGGAAFGALVVGAADRRYGPNDLALLQEVAERVAAALENARLHEVSREAIRARDELLVLTAHELRTPLTGLQLSLDRMLRRGGAKGRDPGEDVATETVARQVRRMSALVERILIALRIRAEGVVPQCKLCDLATIARSCAKAAIDRAGPGAIDVRASAPVVGNWDSEWLERMLRELFDNAVKFGAGKPVEVTVEREDGQAVLTVRDHGVDEIPAERMASIFSPFERVVSKEHYGGLGLGLYTAKAVAEAHGGSIAVTSGRAEGTSVVVRLPVGSGSGSPQKPQ